jgi:hypothetical protein
MQELSTSGFSHMLVGYIRVSHANDRQPVDLQRGALVQIRRPVARMLAWLRAGATVLTSDNSKGLARLLLKQYTAACGGRMRVIAR